MAEELRVGVKQTATRGLKLAATELDTKDSERYMVHLCSGWGSGIEKAAAEAGFKTVAVEIMEGRVGPGSIWVQMDLGRTCWKWWRQTIAAAAGIQVSQMKIYWGGPPCTTMAKPDPSNKRGGKSWNYRDHEKQDRPPAHPEGNARGDEARADDLIAEGMVQMLTTQGEPWAMENPAAYLQCQNYMKQIQHLKKQVSYCAYREKEDVEGGRGGKKERYVSSCDVVINFKGWI